ncbi:methyl-accepting chemotaxis protein [Deinococcus koreensis]|nr:methyl-accepting chemotaxis protein [Deinococcus koreensis]
MTQHTPSLPTSLVEPAPRSADAGASRPDADRRGRFLGLQAKIVMFLLLLLITLTALTSVLSGARLRGALGEEFGTKGRAIASSLASVMPGYVSTQDLSQLQSLIDEYAKVQGVAYVLIQDADQRTIAHTFAPFIPEELQSGAASTASGSTGTAPSSTGTAELRYRDPESGALRHVSDQRVPVLAGQLGTVRIGMDLDLIAAQARQASTSLAIILGVVGLVALLIAAAFAQSIVQPVRRLAEVARRVGEGDLSVQTTGRSNDELGVLARSFNTAIVRLRGMVQTEAERDQERQSREALQANVSAFLDVTMDIAEGDLTRRGEVTEDVLGNVVDSINLMTEELAQTLRQVRGASVTVTSGSQAMLQTTAQIEEGTQATTEQTARIAQQARAISQEIGQMAAIARASAEASRRTLAASTQGQQAVSATMEGMNSIRESSQEAQQRMQALAVRSEEIGQIVETVSHIASQVNLLSLHASIEAAGAGPAGTRFAIVADEVRTLADESTLATARITALVGALRGEIREVAQGIRANAAQVEQGYEIAGTAGASLREIGDLAGITAQLAQNISGATDRQVSSVGEVSRGMQDIAAVASTSQLSAARAREAAQQLEQLAQTLDSRLAHFRLA